MLRKSVIGRGKLFLIATNAEITVGVNWAHNIFCGKLMRKLAKEEYKTGMKQYNVLKWKEAAIPKPDRPTVMLFIPANSSASDFFQLLFENEGRGLIFEPEGDTLSHAFKSDFSDYSDGLQKGFQHETISLFRKTDHEHFEIKKPCLAGVSSGTPTKY